MFEWEPAPVISTAAAYVCFRPKTDTASGYASWDANRDGRITQAEYANCWYGGGFYQTYNRAAWEPSYRVFDTNGDGWLSNEEYWNASAWAQYDRNRDGIIDSSEWPW